MIPDETRTKADIVAWAEEHGVDSSGTKAEILERINDDASAEQAAVEAVDDDTVGEPSPAPVIDHFATGTIPAGAKGPTVARLRTALGMKDGDRLDRATVNRIRRVQARMGVPQTGIADESVRGFLGV